MDPTFKRLMVRVGSQDWHTWKKIQNLPITQGRQHISHWSTVRTRGYSWKNPKEKQVISKGLATLKRQANITC